MNAPTVAVEPARSLSHVEIRSIVVGLMMAMLLAALDQTIVATAMPTIGRDLGNAENLPWIVTAYLLASTAVTPLYGKFSDIHGRRITLLVAIVAFVLGSLACALAPTMVTLALARGLQGIGGGGLISLAQTIIGDIMSPKERARYQVYIASVFVASSLAGPLLGGFLAQHLHWSLIFWINLPIGLAAFLMTNGKLKLLPRHERPHKLDYWGAAFLIVASTSLLLALSWGGVRYSWISTEIFALLGGSVVFWVAFFVRLFQAPEPLIPISVLSDRVVYSATLAACFAMGTFIGLTIYVPIYLEGVIGLSASQSGLALVPLMLGTVTGATVSGRSMTYFKRYKIVPLIMMGISVVVLRPLGRVRTPVAPLDARSLVHADQPRSRHHPAPVHDHHSEHRAVAPAGHRDGQHELLPLARWSPDRGGIRHDRARRHGKRRRRGAARHGQPDPGRRSGPSGVDLPLCVRGGRHRAVAGLVLPGDPRTAAPARSTQAGPRRGARGGGSRRRLRLNSRAVDADGNLNPRRHGPT